MQYFAAAIMIIALLLCAFNHEAAHTLRAAALLAAAAALLCGCQSGPKGEVKRVEHRLPQTGNTKRIPAKYLQKAERRGKVTEFTYETKAYADNKERISKRAYAYLPYGYDPDDKSRRYDIIYFMHGLGGSAGESFRKNGGSLNNILD